MSYLALYRKFRPDNFNDVIGQNSIVKTLTNQITSNKIGHAYLFCGARGTGKTTLAKIFAKSVNCLDFKDGTPCQKCKACLSLNDNSNIDIIEMDAASNNKVENVREIRESVQYPPVNVRYKVYIIDEVHMLTTEAFNALLKTLEEPPKHAIFILATTEPHKLPATILSRCMRFDFRLVSTKEISSLIGKIYDAVGKKYEQDALLAIARAGEGSVRDALSVADLCLSISSGALTYNDVISVIGTTDVSKINDLLTCVFNGDLGGVLSITDELYSLGKSIGVMLKDCVSYLRDLMIVKTCKNAETILNLPKDKLELLKNTSNITNENRILRVIEILSSIENTLKFSTQQRAVLESALLKATLPETDTDISALTARIKDLENKLENLKKREINTQSDTPTKIERPKTVKNTVIEPSLESVIEPPVEFISEPIPTEDFIPPIEEVEVLELPPKPIKDTKVEEKKVEIKTNAQSSNLDSRKIWGSIVRKLRGLPQKTILWVACSEMSAELVGNTLFISPQSQTELQLLNKDGNLEFLNELIKSFGDYEVQIKNNNTTKVDNVKDVENFFKDTVKVID